MAKPNSLDDWTKFQPGGFDPYAMADGYHLDIAAGQKVIDFFESCLTHVRGPMKGQPFLLDLWLKAIVGHLYGWKSDRTGQRRLQELLLLVSRKNAKSLLGAGLALVELFMGDPNGPEIMIGSGDREQARQLFDTVKLMIQQEPELQSRLEVYKNVIKYPARDGWLKVVSSEAYNLHGANLSAAFIDETHVVKRDLVETMATSQGSRAEPLFVNMSTAGYDKHSILYEQRDYALKVQRGIIEDPAYMGIIYEADPEADWTDPETWAAANPGLGRSINLPHMERACKKAQKSPASEANFKRLHLNIWTESESPWLQMAKYDSCVGDIPDLKGRACYAGLDLSTTTDLSAFVLVFPPLGDEPYYVMPFCWCPGDAIRDRSQRDKVPYSVWKSEGFIEATPGQVIDYDYILKRIDQVAQAYDLKAIVFDRWGSVQIIQDIGGRGVELIQFGQGFKSMSPPTKELTKLILENKIMFPKNPVMRWCASNVVVELDSASNIKLSKSKSTEKIDLMIALVMALDAALRNTIKSSVYAEREMLFL